MRKLFIVIGLVSIVACNQDKKHLPTISTYCSGVVNSFGYHLVNMQKIVHDTSFLERDPKDSLKNILVTKRDSNYILFIQGDTVRDKNGIAKKDSLTHLFKLLKTDTVTAPWPFVCEFHSFWYDSNKVKEALLNPYFRIK